MKMTRALRASKHAHEWGYFRIVESARVKMWSTFRVNRNSAAQHTGFPRGQHSRRIEIAELFAGTKILLMLDRIRVLAMMTFANNTYFSVS